MKIGETRALAGPNVYSHQPVLVMQLALEELNECESRTRPGFNEQLLALLPGLAEHHCALGKPGGFLLRLAEGTYFGHVVEHVALELMKLAGLPTSHGKTRESETPGTYRVIVEYTAEQGARFLLHRAVELVETLLGGQAFPLQECLREARQLIARTEPGPSTKAILAAAQRRGIPYTRIGQASLVQLGYGKQRRFIQAALTSQTSAVAVDIACDKELTKTVLREAGLPVPDGMLVESASAAQAALAALGAPVAIKPFNGCQGKGVSLNIANAAQAERAFQLATQFAPKVLVEEQLTGRDYRVLVINGKLAAASERRPAHVVGDGQHTIEQLIEQTNQHPDRGNDHDKALTSITLDTVLLEHLHQRGLSLAYRPQPGEVILLRECANLSTGGTARDVTELVHPEIAALCERAARVIGLDVCGLDLILEDIATPCQPGNGIVEVNAVPGLRMHLSPSAGAPRDVGSAIIEMLYPAGSNGRIPIIATTGTNGKTTITRMIGHAFEAAGHIVGMTTTDGIYIGGRLVQRGDLTGPRSARAVLADPAVEVAVLETARGGLVRDGLGYDWSDVALISNVRMDHLGQDGIECLADLLYVKSLVAERVREGGALILNADDERLARLMEIPRVRRVPKRVIYFSLHPTHILIRRHRAADGWAYLYKDGWLVEAAGERETRLVRAAELPVTLGGLAAFHIANALAAAAACRAQGMSVAQVAAALRSFQAVQHNAGRTGLYEIEGKYVLLDYGHNPDAFVQIGRLAQQWLKPGAACTVTGVIGVPGDRNDLVIAEAGRAAAHSFHRLFIKEDQDLRGRRSGEVAQLLRAAALQAAPQRECRLVLDELAALRTALNEAVPGEIVVIFYEKIEPVLGLLQEYGARPAQTISASWTAQQYLSVAG
jgi:cyanophycin synthetase